MVVTAQHCEAACAHFVSSYECTISSSSNTVAVCLQACSHICTCLYTYWCQVTQGLPYLSAPNSMLLLLLLLLLHFCVQASLCTTSTCTSWAAASCVGHLAKLAAWNMHRDGLMNCWTTSQTDSKDNSVLHCKVRQLRNSISCSWDRSFFHTGM